MATLVRTWNLFHGNAVPPERRAFLRQMIDLVTGDGADVVCLQELPVWSLKHLRRWSGMHATSAVARRPRLPFLARPVTALHHGRVFAAVTGEGGAILTRRPSRDLGATVVGTTNLRRIAHAVELDGVTVVNFHVDADSAQLERVVALAGDRAIVAGDTNIRSLGAPGFSPPLAGSMDQILVRGLRLQEPQHAWPVERRTLEGRVLSDHAPIEAVVE